jgi:hypothetical protein
MNHLTGVEHSGMGLPACKKDRIREEIRKCKELKKGW